MGESTLGFTLRVRFAEFQLCFDISARILHFTSLPLYEEFAHGENIRVGNQTEFVNILEIITQGSSQIVCSKFCDCFQTRQLFCANEYNAHSLHVHSCLFISSIVIPTLSLLKVLAGDVKVKTVWAVVGISCYQEEHPLYHDNLDQLPV